MSFRDVIYLASEVFNSFFLEIVLSGETAIPVTITVTPAELTTAILRNETLLGATGMLATYLIECPKKTVINLLRIIIMLHACMLWYIIYLTGDDDFNGTKIEVTFAPGVSNLSVPVEIVNDFLAEGTEAFVVNLDLLAGPRANRIMTGLNQSTVFIEDDDGKNST